MLLQITRYLRNQIFLIISAKKRENVVECKNQQGRNKIIRGGGIVVTCKRGGSCGGGDSYGARPTLDWKDPVRPRARHQQLVTSQYPNRRAFLSLSLSPLLKRGEELAHSFNGNVAKWRRQRLWRTAQKALSFLYNNNFYIHVYKYISPSLFLKNKKEEEEDDVVFSFFSQSVRSGVERVHEVVALCQKDPPNNIPFPESISQFSLSTTRTDMQQNWFFFFFKIIIKKKPFG